MIAPPAQTRGYLFLNSYVHNLSAPLPGGKAGLPESLATDILAWLRGVALSGPDTGPGGERGQPAVQRLLRPERWESVR